MVGHLCSQCGLETADPTEWEEVAPASQMAFPSIVVMTVSTFVTRTRNKWDKNTLDCCYSSLSMSVTISTFAFHITTTVITTITITMTVTMTTLMMLVTG